MQAGGTRFRRALLAGVATALVLGGCAQGPAEAGGGHGKTGGVHWKQVWADSFTGPAGSPVNGQRWKYNTGHWGFGNHEVEIMTSSTRNVRLDGHGALGITVLKEGTSWTSGRIQTRRYFLPPAGGLMRVAASVRQPDPASGLGYWPAFWLLGPGSWPEHGEIDVVEDVNALSLHSGTFHCGNLAQRNPDGTTGPCHEPTGFGTDLLPCPGCQQGFRTYSVVIDSRHPGRESIRWFLDGREFFSLYEREVGEAAWKQGVHSGYSIILNVAMGGEYPDSECNCTTPTRATTPGGTMTVRYVGVFTSP